MKKLLAGILISTLCIGMGAVGAAADDAAPPVDELTVWHIYGEGDAMYENAAAVIADAEAEFGIKINVVTEETEAYKVKCSPCRLPAYMAQRSLCSTADLGFPATLAPRHRGCLSA